MQDAITFLLIIILKLEPCVLSTVIFLHVSPNPIRTSLAVVSGPAFCVEVFERGKWFVHAFKNYKCNFCNESIEQLYSVRLFIFVGDVTFELFFFTTFSTEVF